MDELVSGGSKCYSHLDAFTGLHYGGAAAQLQELYLFLYNGKLIAGHGVPHFDLFSLEEAAGGGGRAPSWVINMASTATKTCTAAACKPWIKFKHLFCLRPPSVCKSPARLYDQCQDPLSPLCALGCVSFALSLRVATAAAVALIATQGTDYWSVPWALF